MPLLVLSMFDTLIHMLKSFIGGIIVTSAAALFTLVGLQQIGKHHRSPIDKLSQKAEGKKREKYTKVVTTAEKHGNTKKADVACGKIFTSYFDSFIDDVKRGARVIGKSEPEGKAPLRKESRRLRG